MSIVVAFFQFREPVNAWSHAIGLFLSVPATLVLLRHCPENDRVRRLTLLLYGMSLAVCYAGSTLFHAVRVSERWLIWFDALDHFLRDHRLRLQVGSEARRTIETSYSLQVWAPRMLALIDQMLGKQRILERETMAA